MVEETPPICPVCRFPSPHRFQEIDACLYWRCRRCAATFLDPSMRPSASDEKAHYLNHENSIDDQGYRRFLSTLAVPLLERLPPGLSGLDYGCGLGPALAAMLEEAGHRMALYDPFFRRDDRALEARYDLITCSEVVEHFHDPFAEFQRFDRLLNPEGWLGLMTCFQTNDDRFARWHYRRDPTHVVFYRASTFRHIAAMLGWSCEIPLKNVALMRKPLVDD